MKVFVLLAIVLVAASSRVLRAPGIKTINELQNQPGARIIGGNPASLGQFPWQSSVLMDQSFICGGSLISVNYVMTAAHCVYDFSSYQLGLGTLQWNEFSNSATESQYHPNYNSFYMRNDMGIIRLSSPATLGPNVALVALPHGISDTFDNNDVVVSGWGKTSDSGGVSAILNWVGLRTISNDACADIYGSTIIDTTLCTGANGQTSTCSGDSGGPLVLPEQNNVQVGIVSFSSSSGCASAPNGFARVSTLLQFIYDNTDVTQL